MKAQYTPGPWKAVNHYICNNEVQVVARVCASNADDLLTCHYSHLASIGVQETATLIAAAPELLEALNALYDSALTGDPIPLESSVMATAIRAIAKAKGAV